VGEHAKDNDLLVNAQRGKKLTNMRASGSDRNIKLPPAVKMSLEEALEYVNNDECVEVTPKSLRLRKLITDENARKRAEKKSEEMQET
jgi:GTP-binding protein